MALAPAWNEICLAALAGATASHSARRLSIRGFDATVMPVR